jgi:hypothetical protein
MTTNIRCLTSQYSKDLKYTAAVARNIAVFVTFPHQILSHSLQGGGGQRLNLTKKKRKTQKRERTVKPVAVNHCLLLGAERRQTDISFRDPADGAIPHRLLQVNNSTNTQGAAEPIAG